MTNGPTNLVPLVNSVLNANLPAIEAAIKAQPLTVWQDKTTVLEVTNLSLAVQCNNASAASNATGLSFTVVFHVSGEIGALAAFGKTAVPENFVFNGGQVVITASLDETKAKPTIKITGFSAQIQSCQIGVTIIQVLSYLFPNVPNWTAQGVNFALSYYSSQIITQLNGFLDPKSKN